MPEVDFERDTDLLGQGGRNQFVKLNHVGEKIVIRIAKKPYVLGKHWVGQKQPVPCVKIKDKQPCEYCEKAQRDEKNPHSKSGTFKPKIEFYFPVVNRVTHKAEIFQTTTAVYTVMINAKEEGINVYASDWSVRRNEGDVPANYYVTVRLDTVPLTPEEEGELEIAKGVDWSKIFKEEGRLTSMEDAPEEPMTETVEPEDIPF